LALRGSRRRGVSWAVVRAFATEAHRRLPAPALASASNAPSSGCVRG